MYFWITLATLFVLACAAGWRLDRKRKGEVSGRARDSMDGRGNETVMHNRNSDMGGGPSSGGPLPM